MKTGDLLTNSLRSAVFGLLLCMSAQASEGLYDSATLMFNNQEYALALEDYQKILSQKGSGDNDAKAAFYAGECCFQLKSFAKAQEFFKDYLVRFPKHDMRAKGQFRFAEALYLQKNYIQSAQAYERFAKENANDALLADALYAAAGSYLEIGENNAAQGILERFIKDFPNHALVENACYFVACAKFKEKDYSPATKLFLEFSEKYPRSGKKIEALLRAADSCYSGEDFSQSLKLYNRVLAEGQGAFRKDSHVGIAWSYYKLKEFEKAGNYFLILARESKDSSSKSEYYYQCLRSYYDGANFSMGEALGKEMLEACKDQSIAGDVYYWMGLFALKMDKFKDAAIHLEKASGEKCSHVTPAAIYSELGNLFQKQGADEKALEAYKKAMSLSGDDAQMKAKLRYEASRVLHKLGKTQEAIDMVADNLKASSEKGAEIAALSEFSMGEFKYSQKDYAGALKHYSKINERTEKDKGVVQDALYRSAWSWRYLKDLDRASEALLALEKNSDKYRQEARYLLAEIKREQGKVEEAGKLYDQVGELQGKYGAHAKMAKAQMQFDAGKKKDCQISLATLLREFPNSEVEMQARLLLAEVAYDNKNIDDAYKNYDFVVKNGQDSLLESALYGRAWLHFEQSKVEACLADLDALLKAFPKTSYRRSALQLKGQVYMKTNRLDQAREVFNLGISGSSEGGESLMLNLASVETELGHFDKALEVYNQLLTRYPNTELQGRVTYEKGWLYMEMKKPNEALLMFKAYQKSYANGPLIDDVNFALGQLAYDREAYAEAIDAYSRSTRSARYKDKALYKLAYSYMKSNDVVKAAESFAVLVKEMPQSSLRLESMYREGQSWLKAMQLERAELALKNYVEVGRSDAFYADGLFDLGVVSEKLKNSEQALHYYETYSKVFPNGEKQGEVGVYLAHLYLGKKQYSEARQALAKTLLDKTHFLALEAQYLEGEIYYLEGRFEEAIRSFLKTQLYSDGAEWQSKGLLKIAECHRQLQRPERARQYLEQLLQKYPGTEPAREAIELLKKLEKS